MQPNNLERCLKVCHRLLQTALEAMTDVPPAVLEEVLATSHGQEKIKGIQCVTACMCEHTQLAPTGVVMECCRMCEKV